MQRNETFTIASEIVEATKIVVHGNVIRVLVPNRSGFCKREILGRIAMPSSAKVNVLTVTADVECRGSVEQAIIKTLSGDICFDAIAASAEVKSVSGDCLLHASSAGEIDVKIVSGDVTVLVEPDIEIDVEVQSVSGRMSSEIALEAAASGVTGPSLTIHSRTVSGDVQIRRVSLVG